MIKIGKYYYKNFWAFIQVVIFRRPNLRMPKDWKPKPLSKNYNPMEDWTIENFVNWNRHQQCGDR